MANARKIKPIRRLNHGNIVKNRKRITNNEIVIEKINNENFNNRKSI